MEVGFKNKVPCMVKFWTLFLIRSWGLLAMPMSEGVIPMGSVLQEYYSHS